MNEAEEDEEREEDAEEVEEAEDAEANISKAEKRNVGNRRTSESNKIKSGQGAMKREPEGVDHEPEPVREQ